MIRLVGVSRSEQVAEEFVLLQNQGTMRQHLRGHAVVSETSLENGGMGQAWHLFADDEYIQSGCFVMLRSGTGAPRWSRTKDGAMIYITFMNRISPVWAGLPDPLHVMAIQHSYREARESVTVR